MPDKTVTEGMRQIGRDIPQRRPGDPPWSEPVGDPVWQYPSGHIIPEKPKRGWKRILAENSHTGGKGEKP